MRRQIVDLKPRYFQNGSVLYGESTPDSNDVNVTLKDGTVVVVENGTVTVTLPNGVVTQEPIKNSGLGDGVTTGSVMITAGGTIAAIGAALPVPADVIVAAVGGIIAGAGALIKAFSNGRAAQAANKAAYNQELINQQLQSQNAQLDSKIVELQNAIVQAKQALSLNGPEGLGWCLINCAKTAAEARLKTASQIGDELLNAQDVRIDTLQKLSNEAERLFVKKQTINYWYIGTGIVVVGALAYFLTKKLK